MVCEYHTVQVEATLLIPYPPVTAFQLLSCSVTGMQAMCASKERKESRN